MGNMREVSFSNGQIYHVFNRGTERRKIFLSKKDYERFLKNMAAFNDAERSIYNLRRLDVRHPVLNNRDRKPLVDVLCFCLMPNHFHLMLRQRIKNGVSKYKFK